MKKLLISLIVILAAAFGVTAETLDFTGWNFQGASTWNTSYTQRTVEFDNATVIFTSANKQSATASISDCPVTKGQDITVTAKNGMTMSSITFNLKQWGTNAQTVTLHTSSDGVNFTKTSITSSNFVLTAETLPEGTVAAKITFSSTTKQVGLSSIDVTFKSKPEPITPVIAWSVEGSTVEEFSVGFDDKDNVTYPTIVVSNEGDDVKAKILAAIEYSVLQDEPVVEIDETTGKITPLAAGFAIIFANIEESADFHAASCDYELTITPSDIKSLTWSKDSYEFTYGDTPQYPVLSIGGGLTDITYTSDNESVATIDATGKVTIVGAGTTTITAHSDTEGVEDASYTLTINKAETTLSWGETTSFELEAGDTPPHLTLSVTPESLKADVTYATDNAAVATVDAEGNISLAGGFGTATITASYPGNTLYEASTATITITVEDLITEVLIANDFTFASGNGYVNVSYESKETGIIYAGNINNTKTYFQFNNSNKLSGLVITNNPKAYIVKSIEVEFASTSADARGFSIYGKNSAYTGSNAADLYDTSISAIETITKADYKPYKFPTTPEYNYFGLRPNNGVIYISKITIKYAKPVQIDAELEWSGEFEEDGSFRYDRSSGETVTFPTLQIKNTDADEVAKIKEAIVYTSSDNDIATIDKDGNITPIAVGKTTITAKIEEGPYFVGKELSFNLIVEDKTPHLEWVIEGDDENKAFNMTYGQTDVDFPHLSIGGGLKPDYSSDNEAVATVEADEEGQPIITVHGAGDAIITATAGELAPKFTLSVAKATVKLKYSKEEITYSLGDDFEQQQPILTATPEGLAEEILKDVKYESSNPELATVDENGNITPSTDETGEVTITAFIPEDAANFKATSAEVKITLSSSKIATFDFSSAEAWEKWGYQVDDTPVTTPLESNGVKMACDFNTITNKTQQLRYFKNTNDKIYLSCSEKGTGQTITFSAPENYIIEKIVFTADKFALTVDEGLNDKTWEGNASEVVFTTTGQTQLTSATVTCRPMPIQPEIAWTGVSEDNAFFTKAHDSEVEGEPEEITYPTIEVKNEGITDKVAAKIKRAIVYTSSKTAVASITADEDGNPVITPKAAGHTVITASIAESADFHAASCEYTLHVTSDKDGLSWTLIDGALPANYEMNIDYGEEREFPHLAIGGNLVVTYSVENPKDKTVATIDEEGHVTVVGAGTATITATAESELGAEYEASYTLTVGKATPELTWGENIELYFNEVKNFTSPTLSITPASKADEIKAALSYESDNKEVATVEDGVVTLTGKAGKATVTASIKDNANFNDVDGSITIEVLNLVKEELTVVNFDSPKNYSNVEFTSPVTGITYKGYLNTGTSTNAGGMSFNNGTTNAPAGIVSTDNPKGYTIKSVTVEYTAGTLDARTFNINGKATAYNTCADLYTSATTRGTLIGGITKSDASKTVTSDAGYNFIGMRAAPSTGALYISKITIIYEPTTKKAAELAYDKDDFETETGYKARVGRDFTKPELSNPNKLHITYTSSDVKVATVDVDGNVTIVGAGQTTITASFAGNTEYLYDKVSYTIDAESIAESLAEYLDIAPNQDDSALMDCDLLVTFVNGNYTYVTDIDRKASSLIYQSNPKLNYEAGDIIPGGWNAKTNIYNGLYEIAPVNAADMKTATDKIETIKFDNVGDIDLNMVNQIVEIDDVTFSTDTPTNKHYVTGTFNNKEYTIYNMFNAKAVEAGEYNMTVAVSINGTTLLLFPIEYRLHDKHHAKLSFKQHEDEEKYEFLDGDYSKFGEVGEDNQITLDDSKKNKFIYIKFDKPEGSPETHKVFYRFTADTEATPTRLRVAARAGETNTETPVVNVGGDFVEYTGDKPVHPQSSTNPEDDTFVPINKLEYYTENGSGVRTSTKAVTLSGGITGIEDLFVDDDEAEAKYYNLDGVRIMHPAKGEVYIRIVGKKASKVLFY